MARAIEQLEAMLSDGYREEIALYTQALALCEGHAAAAPLQVDSWLPTLMALLEQVAAVESRIATAKADWQRLGQAPGRMLAGYLGQLAALLPALGAAVERVIAAVQARRDQIPLELDALARSSRVRQAYQRIAHAR